MRSPGGPRTLSRPRPVVVWFEKLSDREAEIRNARKLKGTGIFVNEDLCPASMEKKREQFPLMKKEREEGKIAFFRHTRLVIKARIDRHPRQTSSLVPGAGSTSRGAGDNGSVQQASQRSSSPTPGAQLHGLAGSPREPPSGSASGELTVTGTGSPLSAVGW